MLRKGSAQTNWHDYVESRLSAYIDGELPEAERIQVRKHLGECPRCQASLDSLGWTIKLVKQLPAPPLPRQFTLPVPAASPAAARTPAAFGWLRGGLAATAAVAVLAVGVFFGLELLYPTQAHPSNVALAPQLAPVQATAAPAAKSLAPSQPSAATDNSNGERSQTSGAAPTEAPPPAIAAVPATAPRSLGPTSAPTPAPTLRVTRSTIRPTITPTTPCQGCGGGPAAAPPGMGLGGGSDTQPPTPEMGIMATGPAPQGATVVATGKVNATALNIREKPDVEARRLGWLSFDATVKIVGRNSSGLWLEILFAEVNGVEQLGWVDTEFVLLSLPVTDLPVVDGSAPQPPTDPTPVGVVPGRRFPTPTETAAPSSSKDTATPDATLAVTLPSATPVPSVPTISGSGPTVTSTP